jgi:glycosyltransferase involved in cell wall biosynthesis
MRNRSNNPRISIGLPVYNGERYIAESLDSLLAQTFEEFELIVCDNASTDQTEEICRSYADRDARIRYFRHEKNLGAAKNYRYALELSSCAYFRWATYDDLSAPEFLSRCFEVLEREPSVILAYPKTKFINEFGETISEYEDGMYLKSPKASERFTELLRKLRYVNAIYGLFRKDVLKRTGLIRNFPGGDIPLMAELSLYGMFWEVPEFLFYRRFHTGAQSSFKSVAEIQEFFDPKTKGQIAFREWKHLGAHFRSVTRAPIGIIEKIRIACYLCRVGAWNRRELIREARSALMPSK